MTPTRIRLIRPKYYVATYLSTRPLDVSVDLTCSLERADIAVAAAAPVLEENPLSARKQSGA